MRSLSYPTQAHGNYKHLKELIAKVGFKKPIRKLARALPAPDGIGTLSGLANTIVNNHFDFEAFRSLTYNQTAAKAAVADPYFDCVGVTGSIPVAPTIFFNALPYRRSTWLLLG
jgi:hypothetical protein